MAVSLPDGSIFSVANQYGQSIPVTAISNAENAVVTATGHGLAVGDVIELVSGWGAINERLFRVTAVDADDLTLGTVDTSNPEFFEPGAGIGSLRKIESWTQVTQILGLEAQGGEQQFTNFEFLEENFERQLPTKTSAQSLTIRIADDDTLPGYQILEKATQERKARGARIRLPSGAYIFYNGYYSLNTTPSLTKGEVMAVTCTYSLAGRPVRYQASN